MADSTLQSQTRIAVCPSCHAQVRIPSARLNDQPRCPRCKSELFSASPLELDQRGFEALAASELPVLVDFWAPWCAPCRSFAPVIAAAAAELSPSLIVAKLNTEDSPALAARLQIRSIPTVAVFREGREIARQSGALPLPALKRWLAEVGALT